MIANASSAHNNCSTRSCLLSSPRTRPGCQSPPALECLVPGRAFYCPMEASLLPNGSITVANSSKQGDSSWSPIKVYASVHKDVPGQVSAGLYQNYVDLWTLMDSSICMSPLMVFSTNT